jgi:hypothetical protein
MGDYLAAYKSSQNLAKAFQSQASASPDAAYWLLKAQVYSARCLNKIKDTAKAEQVCEDVIRYIEEYREKGGEFIHRLLYQGVKAHYMRAKNMLNVMEYKAAKKILEEEAKPLIHEIIEKYEGDEDGEEKAEPDPTKDLPDGRYSF